MQLVGVHVVAKTSGGFCLFGKMAKNGRMVLQIKMRSFMRAASKSEGTCTSDHESTCATRGTKAAYMKNYRMRLKYERPAEYKLKRECESRRTKIYRMNLSAEKKQQHNEKARIRMQKFRERRKTPASAASVKMSSSEPPNRRLAEEKKHLRREYWKMTKREQWKKMTAQKKTRIREKDRKRKRNDRQGKQVDKHLFPQQWLKKNQRILPCLVVGTADCKIAESDSIVVVASSLEKLTGCLEIYKTVLLAQQKVDSAVGSTVSLVALPLNPPKALIYSPTGPINRDYDDVRRFADAAAAGVKRAYSSGSKRPLLICAPDDAFGKTRVLVTLLGALQALYVPFEIREDVPNRAQKVEKLLVWCQDKGAIQSLIQQAQAIESGRLVARDIGGSDPERMAAPNVCKYVVDLFKDSTNVKVSVIGDDGILLKSYPLFSAVNRCAKLVERHQGRLIKLEYTGEGSVEKTLMFVGKGVTYDTGGADIKAGGVMAGMHRDKCGAATVAGFFQTLDLLKPKNIRVVGTMAMVRNSVGVESYVADEIITSRAGKRVRVGNTDAEGRMAMADCLCEMKEEALTETNPHLFTIATLTGHAIRAMGPHYTIIMDNGPARQTKHALAVQAVGDEVGDPFEISTIRREDYEFHTGKSEYEDILQCNNQPSSSTARGHQSPAAFLIMSSGLDAHGIDSNQPLKYSHLDIAGSSGPFPGVPTGAPIPALALKYLLA